MFDDEEDFRTIICDKLTPEELIEALGVSVEEVFDSFRDKAMELNLDDLFG